MTAVLGTSWQVLKSLRLNIPTSEEERMLYWALVFLIVAILAALLGFGVIASAAAGIAKLLFFVFLVAFLVSLVMHVARRAP
jgi:uncharacterized membrane protein YtjA (UPF0391 family)